MAKLQHVLPVFVCALLGANLGCSSSDSNPEDLEGAGGSAQAGDGAGGGLPAAGGGSATGGANTGTGGAAQTGSGGVGTGGGNSAGATGTGGAGGSAGKGGAGGGGPLPADPCVAANTCPAGTWVNVTPASAKKLDFGTGPIVGDPSRPSDLYMGGGGEGVWKSTDYGNTWAKINDTIPYVPMGYVLTVLPGTPPTVIVAGYKVNHKSTDGGVTYKDIPFSFPDSLYSIQIDPYDSKHLISGLHEVDGIVESTDSGDTWNYVGKGGFPTGGKSWYVFFVDTGAAATTRTTWFAIAQDGGSAVMTSNSGTQWTIPTGLNGFGHPHGNSQICQSGNTMFVPGIGGPGDGLYKSTDMGKSFAKVASGGLGVAWCTSKNVYTMWGWACSKCDLGASFQVGALPAGTTFTKPAVPAGLNIGANHIVVTSDGKHNIFVGTMWAAGVWRYVEP